MSAIGHGRSVRDWDKCRACGEAFPCLPVKTEAVNKLLSARVAIGGIAMGNASWVTRKDRIIDSIYDLIDEIEGTS